MDCPSVIITVKMVLEFNQGMKRRKRIFKCLVGPSRCNIPVILNEQQRRNKIVFKCTYTVYACVLCVYEAIGVLLSVTMPGLCRAPWGHLYAGLEEGGGGNIVAIITGRRMV